MPDNKVKFTFENLQNILSEGSEQLLNYQNKEFQIKTHKIKPRNKIYMDENGQLYTKEKGYKLSRQKYGLMPTFCPVCHKIMGKHPYDKLFWRIHKRCTKCSVKLEQEMKQNGTFDQFAINYMKNKMVSTCDMAIEFYKALKDQNSRSVVINADGESQKWAVENAEEFNQIVDKVIGEIEEYRDGGIKYFDEKLKETQNNEKKLG